MPKYDATNINEIRLINTLKERCHISHIFSVNFWYVLRITKQLFGKCRNQLEHMVHSRNADKEAFSK